MLEKKAELKGTLTGLEKDKLNIQYKEQNTRAGFVYVISNVGSVGENVYKIGVTRRLEPTERIDELGDASVHFDFDIHAMIFNDDAPKLETALHHAFTQRRLNLKNNRREFFGVWRFPRRKCEWILRQPEPSLFVRHSQIAGI